MSARTMMGQAARPTIPAVLTASAGARMLSLRAFISGFVDWYNHHHQHSGIGFHTPANVHYGHAAEVAKERSATLATARAKHPERFTTSTDPKILALPGPAWINQPRETTEQSAA